MKKTLGIFLSVCALFVACCYYFIARVPYEYIPFGDGDFIFGVYGLVALFFILFLTYHYFKRKNDV